MDDADGRLAALLPSSAELLTPDGWERAIEIRYHALRAGSWIAATEIVARMATTLRSVGDEEGARALFRDLDAVPEDNRYARSLRTLYEAPFLPAGTREGLGEKLAEAEVVLAAVLQPGSLADVQLRIGIVELLDGHDESAAGWFEKALTNADAAGDRSARGRMLDEIGMLERRNGKFEDAERHHLEALDIFRSAPDSSPHDLFVCTSALANLMAAQQRWEAGVSYAEEAMSSAQAMGERDRESELAEYAARLSFSSEDPDRAESFLRRALETAPMRDTSDRERVAWLHMQLGHLYAKRGIAWGAVDHATAAERIAPPGSEIHVAAQEWLAAIHAATAATRTTDQRSQ